MKIKEKPLLPEKSDVSLNRPIQSISKGTSQIKIVIALVTTLLGSALPVGHNLGVINTPQKEIRFWLEKSVMYHYNIDLSSSQRNFLWGFVVSIFIVGAFLGSSTGAFLAERYGRCRSFLMIHSCCFLSGLLIICCQFVNRVELLLFGRLLAGLAAGGSMALVPLYLTEIAKPSMKGVMGVMFPFGLCSGILIAQILGFQFLLGTPNTWAFLVGGHAIYAAISLMLHPWLPSTDSETVCSTILKSNCSLEKKDSSASNCDEENMVLVNVSGKMATEKSVSEVFRDSSLWTPIICVIVLNAGQQLAGINAVFFYSTMIFMKAGLTELESQIASLGAGIANVIMAGSAIYLVSRFQRKKLLCFSILLFATCQTILFLSLNFYEGTSSAIWIAIISLFTAVLTYGSGLGPIPYLIGTELFPEDSRRVGLALSSSSNWAANFLVGIFYPYLQDCIGIYSYIIFAVVCVVLMIFVIIFVPETFEKKPSNNERR